MIIAEKILENLVKEGKVKFTEADLKNQSYNKKKLYIRLGAYKNMPVDKVYIDTHGIRIVKKAIDHGYNLKVYTKRIAACMSGFYPNNAAYVLPLNNDEYMDLYTIEKNNDSAYLTKKTIKVLKTYKDIARGKDIFIKGLGSFDITVAYELWDSTRVNRWYSKPVPALRELQVYGYFKPTENISCKAMKTLVKDPKVIRYMLAHGYDYARADEFVDLLVLGLFNASLSRAACDNLLEEVIQRGLKLSYVDKFDFDYKPWAIKLAATEGLTLPKNGIELKQQARTFKNCAGRYVNKINHGQVVMYNGKEMRQYDKNQKLIQRYGPMNKPVAD